MPGLLTVRNLTAQLLKLTTLEHFDGPKARTGLTNLIKKKQSLQLAEDANPTKSDEVDASIEPFEAREIQTPIPGNHVFRLTFQDDDGGQWRIDLPTPSGTSTTLTAISHTPAREFTAIYNERSSTLALFDSTNLSKWMKAFPDETPLSALSIPGT